MEKCHVQHVNTMGSQWALPHYQAVSNGSSPTVSNGSSQCETGLAPLERFLTHLLLTQSTPGFFGQLPLADATGEAKHASLPNVGIWRP
jgi:hypothetical protein